MFLKPLAKITFADLQELVNNQVVEGKNLEYKETLPGDKDREKKEFLYDVSSLANAGGGDLVFGISESDGKANKLIGLDQFEEDKDILRVESILRDGIQPRIPGIKTACIPGGESGPILFMRVPKSWVGPHMVTFQQSSKFYSRSNKGKFPMDISEIRSAIETNLGVSSQMNDWRNTRLSDIASNNGPIFLEEEGSLCVHITPLESVSDRWRFDAKELEGHFARTPPIASSGWSHRYNLDGFLVYTHTDNTRQVASTYLQVFRSGKIEAVTSEAIYNHAGQKSFSGFWCEEAVLKFIAPCLTAMESLGINPPLLINMSLIGIRGAVMQLDHKWSYGDRVVPVNKDVMTLPDFVIEDFQADMSRAARPTFNAMWNAFGVPYSLSYDSDGNWVKKS